MPAALPLQRSRRVGQGIAWPSAAVPARVTCLHACTGITRACTGVTGAPWLGPHCNTPRRFRSPLSSHVCPCHHPMCVAYADALIPYHHVELFMQQQAAHGIAVHHHRWEDTAHCEHYRWVVVLQGCGGCTVLERGNCAARSQSAVHAGQACQLCQGFQGELHFLFRTAHRTLLESPCCTVLFTLCTLAGVQEAPAAVCQPRPVLHRVLPALAHKPGGLGVARQKPFRAESPGLRSELRAGQRGARLPCQNAASASPVSVPGPRLGRRQHECHMLT